MSINLYDLLPEEIWDETAFYLANFVMDIALALESNYLGQIKRDIKGDDTVSYPPAFLYKNNVKDPF